MFLNEYQRLAMVTKKPGLGLSYPILKLNGEAGEVAEKYGKIIRDQAGNMDDDDRREMAKELGDVLWYVASISEELGYDLNTIADMNIRKLSDRAARGVLGGSGDNR